MRKRAVVCFVFWLMAGSAFYAWGEDELSHPVAKVQLEDRVIFTIRHGTKAFSPQYRANGINRRILKFARDFSFDPQTIEVNEGDIADEIASGEFFIMGVLDKDAEGEGRPREELAREIAARIRDAVVDYRENRSLRIIGQGVLLTILSTLALIGLLKLQEYGLRRLQKAVWDAANIPSLRIGSFDLFTADRIKTLVLGMLKALRILVIVILVYIYFHVGLSFFPWTQSLALRLLDYVLTALWAMAGAVWEHTPGLIFIGVLVAVTRYVLKSLRYFFDLVAAGKVTLREFDAELAEPTYRILRLLVIAFAVVVAYPYIPGSDSLAFKGVSVFVGVLFSLGSTSAVGNLGAGLSLTYMRAFREGDLVKIGDTMGIVLQRKTMITRLRTFKNEEVIMANSAVMSAQITNYSLEAKTNGLVLHTGVTIGYDVPWATVHGLLIEAAKTTEHILQSPPPYVLQKSLNDFYVAYELNAYTDTPEKMPRIYSELHANIQDQFNEAGVEIMSPHYTQVRDGNTSTIPAEHLPPGYVPGAIRISGVGQGERGEGT